MSRPKKQYDPKIAQIVENVSACVGNIRTVEQILPDVSRRDLEPEGLYRSEWERGRELVRHKIHQTYIKMALSGKCWQATKHYLATQSRIIEPKEAKPDTDDMMASRPDVVVRFTGKPVEHNENITESTDR